MAERNVIGAAFRRVFGDAFTDELEAIAAKAKSRSINSVDRAREYREQQEAAAAERRRRAAEEDDRWWNK